MATAKKCKHCGETLDVAIRAAEEADRASQRSRGREDEDRREGRRDRDRDDRPPPRRKKGIPTVVWLLGIPFGLFVLCCGGCLMVGGIGSADIQKALKEADQQYAPGQQDQAVRTSKQFFSSAGNKPEILKRIVEYELQKGNVQEAHNWVERGVKEGVAANYASPAARNLLVQVRQEQAAKAAQAKAEQEASVQAQKQEEAKPRKGVTRENYDKVHEGMTLQEVEDLLGPGKESASPGNMRIMTWQGGFVGFRIISISFEDDRVTSKAIAD